MSLRTRVKRLETAARRQKLLSPDDCPACRGGWAQVVFYSPDQPPPGNESPMVCDMCGRDREQANVGAGVNHPQVRVYIPDNGRDRQGRAAGAVPNQGKLASNGNVS